MKPALLPLSLTPPVLHNPSGDSLRAIRPVAPTLPSIEWIERRGMVLQPSPLSPNGDVLGLNLARGCASRCTFCTVRAYPGFAGDEVLQVYRGTATHLDAELSRGRRPRAVFLSPSTDPFPALSEIQSETARVVEVLARHGVEAWLMTRGVIRPSVLRVLARHRQGVKVTVALTTLDARLQDTLEPLTASPQVRLRQIARLRAQGIAVQVALDPLLPGLTDTRENLASLLAAVASVGVRHLSAGYLFLRPGIEKNLHAAPNATGWQERVLAEYQDGPWLSSTGLARAQYLPKARRQRGFATLMALAAAHDITVAVSSTSNPDFATPRPVASSPPTRGPLLAAFLDGQRTLHP